MGILLTVRPINYICLLPTVFSLQHLEFLPNGPIPAQSTCTLQGQSEAEEEDFKKRRGKQERKKGEKQNVLM